ncbi:aminoglycoside phosphotransferase family protein [Saccharopolyspora sp. 5N708]|uniref:aminoglycoside phosphotransferase family protein n=1 Tax=Saccharopolyspora sp. 5N708 TaxID=3457424 RepID=UPI003FCF5E7F
MIDVPDASVATHQDAIVRAWIADLPSLVAEFLDRWELRPDGPTRHGVASLVLLVVRADGVPAALKFQPVNDENVGEPVGLRVWRGDGAVRLLDHDPDTGTMLLERLDADRPLSSMADASPTRSTTSTARSTLTRCGSASSLSRSSSTAAPAAPGSTDRSGNVGPCR